MGQNKHSHTFGHDEARPGEVRTLIIVLVTAVMMVVEIAAGIAFGSMALLADGLHMASHAVALGISFLAYYFARKNARNPNFSFGVGKVTSLAGFASAVLLAGFAFVMAMESLLRLAQPVDILFNQALLVAFVGLVVNGGSALLLAQTPHHHGHDHHHSHDHAHHKHDDHNLRSAYLHVLADALTSVLAIFALLAAKFMGANWMDPMMGIVGAVLVGRWSFGLLVDSGKVLLDWQANSEITDAVKSAIEQEAQVHSVVDLHVWRIGDGILAAEIAIESRSPMTAEEYRCLIPAHLGIVHSTIEVINLK